MSDPNTNTQAIIDVAQQAVGGHFRQDIAGSPVLIRPDNCSVTSLEHFMPNPSRIRAHVTLLTLPAFLGYLGEQHNPEKRNVVFADKNQKSYTGYLGYHTTSQGAWLDNTAVFKLVHSKQFLVWEKACLKPLTQAEFADFLEENSADLLANQGHDMHSVAANFKAFKQTTFANARNKENGDFALTFNTETKGDQTTTVPSEFNIGVFLFEGDAELTPITIGLQWRLGDKGVLFAMRMKLIDRIIEKEWNDQLAIARETLKAANISLFEGQAPARPSPVSMNHC